MSLAWRFDEVQRCEWFALCGNEATTSLPHPVLGDVPVCDRCRKLIEKLGGSDDGRDGDD